MIHRNILAGLIGVLALSRAAWAQQVVTDPQTGRQFQETRWTTQRPVSETRIEQRPYTVYTERLSTEYHPSYRTVYTPVTEYSWEPYMANRWNPLAQPSVGYRYVPRTRWEMRTEESHIPVTRHDVVPETRVAQVPVTSQRFVDEEHITRVAVTPSRDPFTATATTAQPIGGVSALSQDPPRQGSSLVDRR